MKKLTPPVQCQIRTIAMDVVLLVTTVNLAKGVIRGQTRTGPRNYTQDGGMKGAL